MIQQELIRALERYDLIIHSYNENSIILSHESYPNFEAHLFTIADAAGWYPRLIKSGNLELRCPANSSPDRFLGATNELMRKLESYRSRVAAGDIPSFIWAHHETSWHRFVWNASIWTALIPDDFIGYVDLSIRPHILKLNELGFQTKESCSGLLEEHPDREPYYPYVMFDERAYPGITPHLFTLADLASWTSKYAPHNFDVYLKAPRGVKILDSFENLVRNAEFLHLLLKEHSQVIDKSNLSLSLWRERSFSLEQ